MERIFLIKLGEDQVGWLEFYCFIIIILLFSIIVYFSSEPWLVLSFAIDFS